MHFNAPPKMIDERLMVSAREIFEALGATVLEQSDESEGMRVTAVKGSRIVVVREGSAIATINGVERSLENAPVVIKGQFDRLYVPVRFAAEAFGYSVDWDDPQNAAFIMSNEGQVPLICTAVSEDWNQSVNGCNNAANNGFVWQDADWIYYRHVYDGGRLYRIGTDGTGKQKLCDDMALFITVSNGWIYYSNGNDNEDLYRIKTDGTERQKLCDESAYYNTLDGEWLYFIDNTRNGSLYRIRAEGGSIQKILDSACSEFSLAGDWIYYGTGMREHKIWKIKTDGSSNSQVNSDESYYITVSGEWLFYQNASDGKKMYRVRTDGNGREKLTDHPVDYLNAAGDWIYYSGTVDYYEGLLDRPCRLRTDGSDWQKLSDDGAALINVAGDWVYYRNSHDNQKPYRALRDGSHGEAVDWMMR